MVQNLANDFQISVEILKSEQTDNFAEVVVRGHMGDQFIDAVVHHDFKTIYQLKAMELVANNPQILEKWDDKGPVIKEGAKITIREGRDEVVKDARYFLVHALLSFRQFAIRDARTKAARIAEAAHLNKDFQEPEEKESEQSEAGIVQDKKNNERATKQPHK